MCGGGAIGEGLLPSLDTPIGDLVVEAAGTEVGAVTLEQLLSMSGGLPTGLDEADIVRDVVARPLATIPGKGPANRPCHYWKTRKSSSASVPMSKPRSRLVIQSRQ